MSDSVTKLRSIGFGFFCATCDKLHRSLAAGNISAGCEAQQTMSPCGGPVIGMSFPLYEGPLTKSMRAALCFACGMKANKVLQASDGGYMGCCLKHMDLVTVEDQNDSRDAITPVEDTTMPDEIVR